ncbi:GNAT family N-acetyltransferase [Agrilactobacillus yilanensis]|uniref:GNAT family N-acetyltransferase n=1 Tax=Agrilactobacillus yilanensis TaxID=2485997 RepID=A0ABW4JBD7_9LACO|nr:GNAT family N-acetyltransferase [Agrilactobacillus yilanensis]
MIRQAQVADEPQIMTIWLNGNFEAHNFVPQDYWQRHYEETRAMLGQADIYVYEIDGKILGFAGLMADYLAGIFVASAAQSKGIGQALLAAVKADHARITLHVYQKNQHAVNFYKRAGFKIHEEDIDETTGENEFEMTWQRAN